MRDECLNVEIFFTLADARRKLALWLHYYNNHRPHSALADRTPAEFAAVCRGGIDIGKGLAPSNFRTCTAHNDADKTALENAARLPHFHRTAAATSDLTNAPVSSLLLETVT